MSRPPSRYPTELELTILKLLWRDGPMTASHVRDLLAQEADHDIAVTSAITTMNTMVEKGYLSRERDGRAFVYTPEVEEGAVSKGILRDVVERVFDGSASTLMLHLIEDRKITAKERRELEVMIERLSQKPGPAAGGGTKRKKGGKR
ncbi:MAG: BlaI/MecI/CopY family transcriptional regulator [Phycisphaerales bacterium JB063]